MAKTVPDISAKDAYLKAIKYCAYQERCHKEVQEKLWEWGVINQDADQIISELIQENYLNEERFATLFAGSKFRVKQWGRLKIRLELKQRQVSEYCINTALKEINPEEYDTTLQKLIVLKMKTIKDKNPLVRNHKTAAYLMGKGFEPDLVWDKLRTFL